MRKCERERENECDVGKKNERKLYRKIFPTQLKAILKINYGRCFDNFRKGYNCWDIFFHLSAITIISRRQEREKKHLTIKMNEEVTLHFIWLASVYVFFVKLFSFYFFASLLDQIVYVDQFRDTSSKNKSVYMLHSQMIGSNTHLLQMFLFRESRHGMKTCTSFFATWTLHIACQQWI